MRIMLSAGCGWRWGCAFLLGVVLLLNISSISAQDEYRFERLWPVLQQPWYFLDIVDVAVTKQGVTYVLERSNVVWKMSSEGQLIWRRAIEVPSDLPSLPEIFGLDQLVVGSAGEAYARHGNTGTTVSFDEAGRTIAGAVVSGALVGVNTSGEAVFAISDGLETALLAYDRNLQFVQTMFSIPGVSASIAPDQVGSIYARFGGQIHRYTEAGDTLGNWAAMVSGEISASEYGVVELGVADELWDDGTGRMFSDPRVVVYAPDGELLLDQAGPIDGMVRFIYFLSELVGVSITHMGEVYFGNGTVESVVKLDPSGSLLQEFGSASTDPGEFFNPHGLHVDESGKVYVADPTNDRIEVFGPDGEFQLAFGEAGSGNGQFNFVIDVTSDSSGRIYVIDIDLVSLVRVQVFDQNGGFERSWLVVPTDTPGAGWAVSVDQWGKSGTELVVVGDGLSEIKRYSLTGVELEPLPLPVHDTIVGNRMYWGAVNESSLVVADLDSVYRLARTGEVLQTIEVLDEDDLDIIHGIDIDADGLIYLTVNSFDTQSEVRILSESGETIATLGGLDGFQPGLFSRPIGIAVAPNGKVVVADNGNSRVQVFFPVSLVDNSRAIVLAGGGPFPGNDLWDATQLNANFAYRTLSQQGFRKEEIQYLSADANLDLDGNGLLDDVDADASNAELEDAILEWASDADNLLVYLVDHGGGDAFRMSATEILTSDELAGWIDQAQSQLQVNCVARGKGSDCGRITLIYDACQSGSFLDALAAEDRVIITSAQGTQNAYFMSQGSLAFSSNFWIQIFNGQGIRDAFEVARTQTETALPDLQNPQIDADGDGIPNELQDLALVKDIFIGNGASTLGAAPTIGSVTKSVVLFDGNSATIEAFDVADEDGIGRVWAVIRPPDFLPGDAENPVTELPGFDLLQVGAGTYRGSYDQFSTVGTYQLAIYARDTIGNASVPAVTTVSVENPLKRQAMIIAGGDLSDALWSAIERNADVAYDALVEQGYSNSDIYYVSAAGTPGVDGTATLNNLDFAFTELFSEGLQDLVVYAIGDMEGGALRLNSNETLSAEQLDEWLDGTQTAQARKSIQGTIFVLVEGPRSGAFIESMSPPPGRTRIVASSTDVESGAAFLENGEITFSKYFWGRIVNGSTVGKAFAYARDAIQFSNTVQAQQTPQLDDNGNGIANELSDGELAGLYSIGSGVLLAGDDPIIGSVSPAQVLNGNTSALLFAEDVTTTGEIDRVFGVVTPPGFQQTGGAVDMLPTFDLNPKANKTTRYEGSYNGFDVQGTYQIGIYAVDTDGVISFPQTTSVTQTQGELPITLPASMAGSWFPAGHSGEGFLFEVIAPGIAVVYWFTYDGEGNQRWLFGIGTIIENRIEVAELLEASGGVFGEDFDPDAISFKTVGNAIFSFSSCDAGIVEFTVDGTPGEYNIKRITNIEGLTCQGVTKQSVKSGLHGGRSGSWFNAERNGEGFLVEVIALPDGTLVLVIYFFTFDPEGNLAWMVASGIVDGTDTLTMDVFQPVGGVFGSDFDPADVSNINWGSMTFQLSCSAGIVSFESTQPGYGSAERVLSRITNQLGVSCNP